jgi:hypothetical protein
MKPFSAISLLFTLIGFAGSLTAQENIQQVREKLESEFPTMVSDTSSVNKASADLGYKLTRLQLSPCDASVSGIAKERIARKEFTEDQIEIEVAINANCCSSFLGEIEILSDSILNLKYTEYGEQCMCSCCFHLTYTIETNNLSFNSYQLNGTEIVETDQVSKKENCYEEYYDNGELKRVVCSVDNEVVFIKSYDFEGELTKTEYVVDGKLIEKKK